MRWRTPLAIILALAVLAPTALWAQAKTTITLWYPAGDITAGAAHFGEKNLWADFEKKAISSVNYREEFFGEGEHRIERYASLVETPEEPPAGHPAVAREGVPRP